MWRRAVRCFLRHVNRSGSGDVTQTLTSLLPEAIVLATDVNILASAKTSSLISSGTTTHSTVDVIMADLFSAFTSQTKFDIIIFNPPYVPTDEDELERALTTHDISAAWAGGRKGRYVIDKFLKSLPSALSSNAVAYLVLLKENDPVQISGLATKQGLSASIVLHRQSGIESLYIMRFYVLY